jgi:hypothetical protein
MSPLFVIGQNLHYVMMQYSLHNASTMHLKMISDGPDMRRDLVWVRIYKKNQHVLGLMMALWLKK